eukprot:GILK01011101.1.p1 GENE.GILK01011101.1~~GILK01011101.1.p1  ORF type:complete len:958 (-),score=137.87 GILK01011101.1:61-2934(-)
MYSALITMSTSDRDEKSDVSSLSDYEEAQTADDETALEMDKMALNSSPSPLAMEQVGSDAAESSGDSPVADVDVDDEEDDSAGVYEINDYTTATSWEKFVATIEECLRVWNLQHGTASPPSSTEDFYKKLSLGKKEYKLSYHFSSSSGVNRSEEFGHFPEAMSDLMDVTQDFPTRAPKLQRWFGVCRFLLLTPVTVSGREREVDISEASLMLSSLNLALSHSGCALPAFVPVHSRARGTFLGYMSHAGVRIRFDTDTMSSTPESYNHLSGLLDLFITKLDVPPSVIKKSTVSARYTYVCDEFGESLEQAIEKSLKDSDQESILPTDKYLLTPTEEPVKSMHLACTWPAFPEGSFVDNAVYSEFSALAAPEWSLRTIFIDEEDAGDMDGLLARGAKRMAALINEVERFSTVSSLLSADALEGTAYIQQFARNLTNSLQSPTIPSDEQLSLWLDELFSATNSESESESESPVADSQSKKDDDEKRTERSPSRFVSRITSRSDLNQHAMNNLKSAPGGSLLSWLSLQWSTLWGLKALATFWIEFGRTLRHHWESRTLLPRMPVGELPDLKYCLLYQKLQMLNYCIHRELSITSREKSSHGDTSPHDDGLGRRGTLRRADGLFLKSGAPMYAPVVQDPCPRTEDEVERFQSMLQRLSAKERTRVQPELLSDMSAFKAANPGCDIEDFLQWWSPRARQQWPRNTTRYDSASTVTDGTSAEGVDTVDAASDLDEEEGSERSTGGRGGGKACQSDEVWQDLWQSAPAVPANEQKPLFDCEREAEMTLHYFDTIEPVDLMRQMFVVFQTSIPWLLTRSPAMNLKPVQEAVQHLQEVISMNCNFNMDGAQLSSVVAAVTETESLAAKGASLLSLIPSELALVSEMLVQGDCPIESETQRSKVMEVFKHHSSERLPNQLPPPYAREFILRCVAPKHDASSRAVANRMYALLRKKEFRIATAFGASEI